MQFDFEEFIAYVECHNVKTIFSILAKGARPRNMKIKLFTNKKEDFAVGDYSGAVSDGLANGIGVFTTGQTVFYGLFEKGYRKSGFYYNAACELICKITDIDYFGSQITGAIYFPDSQRTASGAMNMSFVFVQDVQIETPDKAFIYTGKFNVISADNKYLDIKLQGRGNIAFGTCWFEAEFADDKLKGKTISSSGQTHSYEVSKYVDLPALHQFGFVPVWIMCDVQNGKANGTAYVWFSNGVVGQLRANEGSVYDLRIKSKTASVNLFMLKGFQVLTADVAGVRKVMVLGRKFQFYGDKMQGRLNGCLVVKNRIFGGDMELKNDGITSKQCIIANESNIIHKGVVVASQPTEQQVALNEITENKPPVQEKKFQSQVSQQALPASKQQKQQVSLTQTIEEDIDDDVFFPKRNQLQPIHPVQKQTSVNQLLPQNISFVEQQEQNHSSHEIQHYQTEPTNDQINDNDDQNLFDSDGFAIPKKQEAFIMELPVASTFDQEAQAAPSSKIIPKYLDAEINQSQSLPNARSQKQLMLSRTSFSNSRDLLQNQSQSKLSKQIYSQKAEQEVIIIPTKPSLSSNKNSQIHQTFEENRPNTSYISLVQAEQAPVLLPPKPKRVEPQFITDDSTDSYKMEEIDIIQPKFHSLTQEQIASNFQQQQADSMQAIPENAEMQTIKKSTYYFQGNVVNKRKNGTGYMKTHDWIFNGNFSNNYPVNGTLTFRQSGSIFCGQLFLEHPTSSKLNGTGVVKTTDGRVLKGQFLDSQQIGQGSIEFLNGTIIESVFVSGKPAGITKVSQNNGDWQIGTFENQQLINVFQERIADRIFEYLSNDDSRFVAIVRGTDFIYSGQLNSFKEFHGQGILKDNRDNIIEGQFVRNRKHDPNIKMTLENGLVYTGECYDDGAFGNGMLSNGLNAQWVNGTLKVIRNKQASRLNTTQKTTKQQPLEQLDNNNKFMDYPYHTAQPI